MKDGKESDWQTIDIEVKKKLNNLDKSKKITILTSTILSPSTKQLIKDFTKKYNNAEHIMFDSVPYDGILDANHNSFGIRAIPAYKFEKANIIVSFGADFLGNWGANNYSADYINGRKPKSGNLLLPFFPPPQSELIPPVPAKVSLFASASGLLSLA